MPNLAGVGVFGWPREGNGSAPLPSRNFFGVLNDGTGTWRTARRVWTWCPTSNAWKMIWSLTADAALSVTIAKQTINDPNIVVTWTLPPVNANTGWIVRRQDGSVVGTVSATTTTLTDFTPVINSGEWPTSTALSYTVAGVLGSAESSRVTSNVINMSVDPGCVTVTPQYPDASSGSTANLLVQWTDNGVQAPDYWRIWISGNFVTGNISGTTRAFTVTGIARGYQYNVRVIPFTARADGSVVQSGNWQTGINANVTPNVSRPQSLASLGSLYWMRFAFWGPAAGAATQYHVQTWQDGVWTDRGYGHTSGIFDWQATGGVYARVATWTAAGESDWAQIGPAWPITDTTGPGAPSIASWQPEASHGRMVVRGNWPGDGDVNYGRIWTSVYGGGWVLAWEGGASPGGAFAFAVQFSAGQQPCVLTQAWDAVGNPGAQASACYATLMDSTVYVDPNNATRWTGAAWTGGTWAGAGQGWSYVYYPQTLWDILHQPGRTITQIRLEYGRQQYGTEPNWVEPYIYVHTETGPNSAPAPQGGWGGMQALSWPGVAGASTVHPLPQEVVDNLRGGYRGIAFVDTTPNNTGFLFSDWGNGWAPPGSTAIVGFRMQIDSLG